MKTAALIALVLLVLLVAVPRLLAPNGDGRPEQVVQDLPWQIEILPEGRSRVFGLTIGASTLGDALERFGELGELAIVAAPGEAGSLEMFYKDVTMGAITGSLVLTGDVTAAALEKMRARAENVEYMKSSTKKATLHLDDRALALAAPLRAIAFIPSANLDEATIVQRFGAPAERLRSTEHTEHFLYPDRGLDLILDSKGKELLQYVAPASFAQLRQPLLAKPAE